MSDVACFKAMESAMEDAIASGFWAVVAIGVAYGLYRGLKHWLAVREILHAEPAIDFEVSMELLEQETTPMVARLKGKVAGVTLAGGRCCLIDTNAIEHELLEGPHEVVEAKAHWAAETLGVELHVVSNPNFGGAGHV